MLSSNEAKSFVERSADPFVSVKKHYKSLIRSINFCDREVAIYIDDIDRCDKENVVRLLEGIQTLFREKRVLFIIAGDKKWISNCFDKYYEDFETITYESGERLGELFVEKVFQLSARLPNISPETKEKYWNFILDINEDDKSELGEPNEESKKSHMPRATAVKELTNNYSIEQLRDPAVIEDFRKRTGLGQKEATGAQLEVLDKSHKDVKHLLKEFHDMIEANPRTIKRLANEYIVLRNTLIAESVKPNVKVLFRWVILKNQYSATAWKIEKNPSALNDDAIDFIIKSSKNPPKVRSLIVDEEDRMGGQLTKEIFSQIIGGSI